MKLTKTWFSYIIWGLFSVIFFADIGISAIEIYQKKETVDFLIPVVCMYAYAFVGILLLIGIYKLFEKFILSRLVVEEGTGMKAWQEGFLFALILIVAIAIRAIAVIASGGELIGTTAFFDYAISSDGKAVLDTYNNGAFIFGGILKFLLGFLGHKAMAAMAVQATIQSITLIVLYFAVKKGLGRIPAFIAFGMASFLPGSFMGVKTCTPDALYVLLFVIYMLFLILLCDANRAQKIHMGGQGAFYIMLGLFSAFLAYYDVIGFVCILITIVAFAQSKNEDAWMTIQKPWLQILLYLIAFIPAFLFSLWFVPANGLEAGPAGIVCYFTDLIHNFGLDLMILSPHKGYWDTLALYIMSGLWFIGFLRDKNDKAFPFALTVVMTTLITFLGVEAYEYGNLVSLAWILLATIGITSMSAFRKTAKDEENAAKTKQAVKEKKAEKERKRSEAAGEKSIRFNDNTQNKRKAVEQTEPLANEKKSYGIGRKADDVRPEAGKEAAMKAVEMKVVSEEGNTVGHKAFAGDTSTVHKVTSGNPSIVHSVSQDSTLKENSVSSDNNSFGNIPSDDSSFAVARNVVKKVDRPPLVAPPTPTPIESKPAYSQGSRSRRGYRTPSKSTFTQEDLERISRYEGANLVTASTLKLQNEVLKETESEVQVIPEQTVARPEQVVPSPEQTVASTEPAVTGIEQAVASPEQVVASQEQTVANQKEATPNQEQPAAKAVQSAPAYSYGSPSRRHYRYPSKSTFTPEELEKISQYTGATYKQPENDSIQIDNINQNGERKPKLIRNPLPGPKPHVSKDFNYDYLPKESEMKFDIDDLKGRDYFDL